MLQLQNIKKQYEIGKRRDKDYQIVNALNGINLSFREHEFVSILGPSGCGKTTMLNIIGGLDKYTSGDLIIRGKSTKEFKDKDWDNYRNHSVGFVFQSYNLIHHQTILQNVELALTLSGVSRTERKIRALDALDKVGLKERANNKPNQLSGGQMQRVAIARAIVNNPDIILADEPTGALDSKTSVQIMNILSELSKEKLVIMVTHNPELAEDYSSRIVRLKDGNVVSDNNPYNPDEENYINDIQNAENIAKQSANNELLTNQVQLTESGNIVENSSNSKQLNQDNIVEDKLDINSQNVKTATSSSKKHNKNKSKMSFFTALSLSFKNLLTKKARTILVSFAGSIGIIGIALILAVSSGFSGYINKVQEDTLSSYPIVIEEQSVNYMNIMGSMFSGNNNPNHDNDAVYSNDTLSSILNSFTNAMDTNDMASFNAYLQEHYSEIEPYINAIKYTYNLDLNIYKDTDTTFTEALSPNSNALYNLIITYSLVYLQQQTNIDVQILDTGVKLTYIEGTSDLTFFETYQNIKDEQNGVDMGDIYTQLRDNHEYMLQEKDIVVIIGILFKLDITSYKNMDLGIFNEMIDNPGFIHSQYNLLYGSWNNEKIYIENGKTYADTLLVLNENNELDDYLLYSLGFIDKEEMNNLFNSMLAKTDYTIKIDYNKIVGKEFRLYLKSDTYYLDGDKYTQTENKIPSEEHVDDYITLRISGIVRLNQETNGGALNEGIVYPKALTDYCIDKFNNSAVVTSGQINGIDKSNPITISIYANSFEMKEVIENFISKYNASVEESKKITYTDYMSLMMSTVSSIVDTVSYVLIAFVSVSLIVSSIMIGIITYISVLERTKEIGVLRSVGASKKDIKRVFTAESLIIGFTSGTLGIIITLLLCIPINIIFKAFTGIGSLASLPIGGGIILILISMALTFIAGLIPAKVASKKDPVVALRTE